MIALAESGVGDGVGAIPESGPDGSNPPGALVPEPKFPEQAASAAPVTIRTARTNRA